jgi:tetratricopeptide (TPR) repeat protein/DNA-binding CsgD family transcriptional regulator
MTATRYILCILLCFFISQEAYSQNQYHKDLAMREHVHQKAIAMQNKDDVAFLEFVHQEINYSKQIMDPELVIESYTFSIGYLIRKRNFAKAIEYSNDALFYFDRLKLHPYKARIYSLLGSICMQRKEYNEAAHYGQLALEQAKNMQGTTQVSYYLSNIGYAYLKKGEYHLALDYLAKGLTQTKPIFKSSIDYKNLEIVVLIHSAMCSIKIHEEQQAYIFLNRAKSLFSKLGKMEKNAQLETRIYLCESEYFVAINQLEAAIQSAQKGLLVSTKLPNFRIELLDVLTKLYAKRHDFKSAFNCSQTRTTLVDSLNTSELNEISQIIETNIKLAQKEKNHVITSFQMKLDVKSKRIQNGILFLVLILVLIGLVFLWHYFRKKQQKAKTITNRLELEKKNISLDLENKNKELSFFSMKQAHMDQFILSLKRELEKNKRIFQNEQLDYVNGIIRKLKNSATAANWEEFEIRFQQTHTEFYTRLSSLFPGLTANERRICSFVKLGMSTKEMASITGQSTNSIGVARIRLRKKLGITNEELRLDEFLNQI